ncbi:hypothetical protein PR003_g21379 [Phytophthora rubi]|uniref:Uncharacterized protein n=1 Tax=Phytophthora rubi TaxID=129364 RepID=A0A6A3JS72_9STRA|nr:hypothetical protein PR001_g20245 [Phytophthora rubi]KAE9032657.1 hypothetical protein PR002_g9077 [Phytophthora rubi]KAE9305867.1 hypothetical protein PR003_g21379 [Phytophthora rubi]
MRDVEGDARRSTRQIPRDGSELIKDFVQEAEQRRIACRFARTGRGLTPRPPEHRQTQTPSRPHTRTTGSNCEDDQLEVRSGTPVSRPDNQQDEDTAAMVEGLFTTKHMQQRNRQISLTPAMLPAAAAAAASGLGANNKPMFTFTRRKLQMESVNAQSGAAPHRAPLGSPAAVAITTSQHLGHRSRTSNFAAKLDAMLRSSPWMRRKVVMQPQVKGQSQRVLSNASTLRLLAGYSSPASPVHNHQEVIDVSSGSANEKHHKQRKAGHHFNDGDSNEAEKRMMATFQRFVRLWRERKRRSEQAALNMAHGNGTVQPNHTSGPANGNNNTSGRNGGKLSREVDAQSSNVASILSRRKIGEVPALKFFDEDESTAADQAVPDPILIAAAAARARPVHSEITDGISSSGARHSTKLHARTLGDLMVSPSLGGGGLGGGLSPHRRVTPRGVCYTLDESGCRRIKMQSGALARTRGGALKTHGAHKMAEEITVEKATSKSLRRKMIRRVKLKHQAIGRLSDDFKRSRNALTAKLGSQLALRQAEGEQMFGKRLSLLLSNNVELPPHMAAKELALARLRFKKANLQARCQTLAVLGAALHHVETAGEVSGLEISSGEQQFLELLRCAVEGDHALTPLLVNGILGQFNSEQRHKPLVAGLLALLERTTSTETCANHHIFTI